MRESFRLRQIREVSPDFLVPKENVSMMQLHVDVGNGYYLRGSTKPRYFKDYVLRNK